MKIRMQLAALAVLLGSAGFSHAVQTIASPPLPTVTNTAGACYLRNIGTRPISLQVSGLVNFTAGFNTPSFQNCNNAPLDPGRTCVLLFDDLDDDVTFACSAVVTGNAKSIRGNVEIRQITTSGLRVVADAEMK